MDLELADLEARKMWWRLGRRVELEDLRGAACVGLVEAHGRYRPGHGTSFRQYARRRIRGSMIDSIRDLDPSRRRYWQETEGLIKAVEDLSSHGSVQPEAEDAVLKREVRDAVRRLPPSLMLTVFYKYWGDNRVAPGVPQPENWQRHRRAIQRLKSTLNRGTSHARH